MLWSAESDIVCVGVLVCLPNEDSCKLVRSSLVAVLSVAPAGVGEKGQPYTEKQREWCQRRMWNLPHHQSVCQTV
jgi:hypothetical protein